MFATYCLHLQVSWTHALRTIVINCYKHHGRDDLLPEFIEDKCKEIEASQNQVTSLPTATLLPSHAVVHTINNPDGTVSLIQVDTGATVATLADVTVIISLYLILKNKEYLKKNKMSGIISVKDCHKMSFII